MSVIQVRLDSPVGSAAAGKPVSFSIFDRIFAVMEILDTWYGADHTYYKLIADDGNLYIIKHDLNVDAWELVQMEVISG
jgi:hypothetical protein